MRSIFFKVRLDTKINNQELIQLKVHKSWDSQILDNYYSAKCPLAAKISKIFYINVIF